MVTKEHKSVSQSSRNVKGLGSKKNKRDDGEGGEGDDSKNRKKAKRDRKGQAPYLYSKKHVMNATMSRYQALDKK